MWHFRSTSSQVLVVLRRELAKLQVLPAFLASDKFTHYVFIASENHDKCNFRFSGLPEESTKNAHILAEKQGAAFMVECVDTILNKVGERVVGHFEPKKLMTVEEATDAINNLLMPLGEQAKILFHLDEHRHMCLREYGYDKIGASFTRGAMTALALVKNVRVVATHIEPLDSIPAVKSWGICCSLFICHVLLWVKDWWQRKKWQKFQTEFVLFFSFKEVFVFVVSQSVFVFFFVLFFVEQIVLLLQETFCPIHKRQEIQVSPKKIKENKRRVAWLVLLLDKKKHMVLSFWHKNIRTKRLVFLSFWCRNPHKSHKFLRQSVVFPSTGNKNKKQKNKKTKRPIMTRLAQLRQSLLTSLSWHVQMFFLMFSFLFCLLGTWAGFGEFSKSLSASSDDDVHSWTQMRLHKETILWCDHQQQKTQTNKKTIVGVWSKKKEWLIDSLTILVATLCGPAMIASGTNFALQVKEIKTKQNSQSITWANKQTVFARPNTKEDLAAMHFHFSLRI